MYFSKSGRGDSVEVAMPICVRIRLGRSTVLQTQIRRSIRHVAAMMAGVATHPFRSSERTRIDCVHHRNHTPRNLYFWSLQRKCSDVANRLFHMAVRAAISQRGGKQAHHVHEFVYGDTFQNTDVFERFLSHLWAHRLCSLGASVHKTAEAHESNNTQNWPFPSEIHFHLSKPTPTNHMRDLNGFKPTGFSTPTIGGLG